MPPPHHDHDHHHHHGHHHDHHHKHHHEPTKDPWDDVDWKDLNAEQKKAAKVLGYDQKLWDSDGKVETDDYDWHELSHEQRQAAETFGYHPKLWDTGHGEFHHHDHHHHHPPHHHDHHHHHHHDDKKEEEKKDNSDSEDDEDGTPDISNLNVDGKKKNETKQEKKKPTFKVSQPYGGTGGDAFDHGNNRHISKITIFTDNHVVRGMEIKYANATQTAGNTKKSMSNKPHEFELEKGEFITTTVVRSNKYVQSLGFKTNKGRAFGPIGGKGWTKLDITGNDTEGENHVVQAPFKLQLCGVMGRAGSCIDQITFRWGPVP